MFFHKTVEKQFPIENSSNRKRIDKNREEITKIYLTYYKLLILQSLINAYKFFNTYKFSNHDNIKFILFLRKGVYPYEHMDDWEKFSEILLPEKEELYSQLNMEDITDANYAYAKRVCKDFEIKKLGEYCDMYVQSDTLLLRFRPFEICIMKYTNLILQNFFHLLD